MAGNDDNNRSRTIAVAAILLLVAGAAGIMWFMGANNGEDEKDIAVLDTPEVEPEAVEPTPEPWEEPAPEILPPVEPEPLPEEPEIVPVACAFPGDGFIQAPHGFRPTQQFVEFDPPEYLSGYSGSSLPLIAEEDGEACVSLTYDISERGRPINVQVLDAKGREGTTSDYMDRARTALSTRRYLPGARNDKPVRIDNNFLIIRFSN
ncbi:MAG: energy transducer TonB [Aquisalinus sp.]|nr:energy transducer TonB [Aquisalinus sp.]